MIGKKKITFILIIIVVLCFSLTVKADNSTCTGIFGPNLLAELKDILGIIRIVAPVLLILLTSLDFAKVVFADKKDGLKKAKDNFLKRAVAILIIFFAPNIIMLILSLVDEATISAACINEMENAQYVPVEDNRSRDRENPTKEQQTNTIDNRVDAITGVTMRKNTVKIPKGSKYQVSASVNDNAYDNTLTWSSDYPSIASVDKNGLVTAISVGVAKIRATAVNGLYAECEITVTTSEDDMIKLDNLQYAAIDKFGFGKYVQISIDSTYDEYNRLYMSIQDCGTSGVCPQIDVNQAIEISAIGCWSDGCINPQINQTYYYSFANIKSKHFLINKANISGTYKLCWFVYNTQKNKASYQSCYYESN